MPFVIRMRNVPSMVLLATVATTTLFGVNVRGQGCGGDLNCDDCDNGGVCTQCEDFAGLNAEKRCVRCADAGCKKCRHDYATCTECASGYRLNANGVCEACTAPNCAECNAGANTCSSCNGGFYNNNNACFACAIENCVGCDPMGRCYQCVPGYTPVLNGYLIASCQACTTEGCARCDPQNPGLCQSCLDGYRLTAQRTCEACNDRLCKNCESSAAQCTQCVDFALFGEDGVCTNTDSGAPPVTSTTTTSPPTEDVTSTTTTSAPTEDVTSTTSTTPGPITTPPSTTTTTSSTVSPTGSPISCNGIDNCAVCDAMSNCLLCHPGYKHDTFRRCVPLSDGVVSPASAARLLATFAFGAVAVIIGFTA